MPTFRRLCPAVCVLLFPFAASCQPAQGPTQPTRAEYRAAIERAWAWLDATEVDPVRLQRHVLTGTAERVKGKKKLAEILDAYLTLYNHVADATGKQRIHDRVATLVDVTRHDAYHDMATADDTAFKQNSTSYLRVCYLMDQFGLPIDDYRKQIAAVQPRLDEHLKQRGVSQRMNFTFYYDYLRLPKPPVLEEAHVETGLIVSRHPLHKYDRLDEYSLTHEVFAAYEYGRGKQSDTFNDGDRVYLRSTIPPLLERCMEKRDYDLGAEYVSCLTYLGMTDLPIYPRAIRFLLDGQNNNGTWGDYERARAQVGDVVDQWLYLHTTLVAIQSLVEAFDGDWPAAVDFP